MYNIKIEQGLEKLPDAKSIREAVFVAEQRFNKDNEFDAVDTSAFHILIADNDIPMATGRLYQKEGETDTFHLGRIAVLEQFRNLHLGSLVVELLEKHGILIDELEHKKSRDTKAHDICFELSAQVRVQKFYEKLGYKTIGDIYLDEHEPHISMVKKIRQGA